MKFHWLILILGTVTVLAFIVKSGYFDQISRRPKSDMLRELYKGSFSFYNIDYRKYEKNKLKSQLLAASATYQKNQTLLFENGVKMHMFEKSDEKLTITGTKAIATFNTKKGKPGFFDSTDMQNIKVWNKVQGHHPRYKFSADQLFYDVQTGLVSINNNVNFSSAQIQSSGETAQYELKGKNFQISGNVRGTIQASEKKK